MFKKTIIAILSITVLLFTISAFGGSNIHPEPTPETGPNKHPLAKAWRGTSVIKFFKKNGVEKRVSKSSRVISISIKNGKIKLACGIEPWPGTTIICPIYKFDLTYSGEVLLDGAVVGELKKNQLTLNYDMEDDGGHYKVFVSAKVENEKLDFQLSYDLTPPQSLPDFTITAEKISPEYNCRLVGEDGTLYGVGLDKEAESQYLTLYYSSPKRKKNGSRLPSSSSWKHSCKKTENNIVCPGGTRYDGFLLNIDLSSNTALLQKKESLYSDKINHLGVMHCAPDGRLDNL